MNRERIDLLLKYALAIAGQEDLGSREVGAIHLIKYVYLGDLAYSEQHAGETFTGVPWRFHHFGPWAEAVFERIKPVAQITGATERRAHNPRFGEMVRWTLRDESLLKETEAQTPWSIARAIKKAVHEYGNDTSGLLHSVYRTVPMLRAAPGETLTFAVAECSASEESVPSSVPQVHTLESTRLSTRERRELGEQIRRALDERRTAHVVSPDPPPRYDEVFEKGQIWLDGLAGEPIQSDTGEVTFSKEIWKSRGRGESDVS